MSSKRYITAAIFGLITFGLLFEYTFFNSTESEQLPVSAPMSAPVVGGVVEPEKTPASVKLTRNDIKAAFERDTVIKLNSIVRRSLTTIREYDAEIQTVREESLVASQGGVNAKQVAAARLSLAKLQAWSLEASRALKDMNAAVQELEASDEHYNAAILAGMVRFVETVATEIGDEYAKQTKLVVQSASTVGTEP